MCRAGRTDIAAIRREDARVASLHGAALGELFEQLLGRVNVSGLAA